MIPIDVQEVVREVLIRAQREGSVGPAEVREELARAGLPETRWEEVLRLAGPALAQREDRYFYLSPNKGRMQARMRAEQPLRTRLREAVTQLIRLQPFENSHAERREYHRFRFVQAVQVLTADQRQLNISSCDISESGMRLVGPVNLLGQEIRVLIPRSDNSSQRWCFTVQILWASPVGNGMIENGGLFLKLTEEA